MQLQFLVDFPAEDPYTAVPAGIVQLAMLAKFHSSTLPATLVAVFECATGDAPAICKVRVRMLRAEFELVDRALKEHKL